MILNAKNNQFVFRFPKNFIPSEIQEKYDFYLKRLPTPFENILDYLNHTIQAVTFPSVNSELIEQMIGRKIMVDDRQVSKNPQRWRQSLDLERIFPKDFTVSLKAADGYLNYWVMFETLKHYLTVPNKEDYFPDMSIEYLDREGYLMLKIDFRQPLFTGISEVEMNYTATAMEFRTFSANFSYNWFDININP